MLKMTNSRISLNRLKQSIKRQGLTDIVNQEIKDLDNLLDTLEDTQYNYNSINQVEHLIGSIKQDRINNIKNLNNLSSIYACILSVLFDIELESLDNRLELHYK